MLLQKNWIFFRARQGTGFWLNQWGMASKLPAVGTVALLQRLSFFVPDDFINQQWPTPRQRGPRRRFSTAQLWRVHLLALLTGGRSFNAIQRSLSEQRALRRFAQLPNAHAIPDVRMLCEFRRRLGAGGLRAINDHLTGEVLLAAPLRDKTVALIDATDLPASTRDKKKMANLGAQHRRHWEHARLNRAAHVFLSAIKNTPLDYGSMVLNRSFC